MHKLKLVSKLMIPMIAAGLLVGCGNSSEADKANDSAASSSAIAEAGPASSSVDNTTEDTSNNTAETEATSESANTSSTIEEDIPIEIKGITERSDEMRDISAKELVAEMTAGWNLGNTLEATGDAGLSSETSWGNPMVTKEQIDAVCEKGFDSIRIPVTWGNHVSEAPDYTIDPEWMDRVEEVVNYALDDGMYVLIDSHHEESWRIPDEEHIEAVDAENIAIWKQVAERFKDYGDHLIFEGLNEPRIKGSADEWNGGTYSERLLVNRLNKSFVDTVRATGGNNEKRLLLITTYGDSHLPGAITALEIPEDEHIGVAIHAYEPYAFTYESGESWELFKWDGSHNGDIIKVMYRLDSTFISEGIPVLLTEYGAVNKNENTDEVVKWTESYVSAATKRGIPCFWWDNGIYDQQGEKFAIFDRKNLSWYREEVVDTIIRESYSK